MKKYAILHCYNEIEWKTSKDDIFNRIFEKYGSFDGDVIEEYNTLEEAKENLKKYACTVNKFNKFRMDVGVWYVAEYNEEYETWDEVDFAEWNESAEFYDE